MFLKNIPIWILSKAMRFGFSNDRHVVAGYFGIVDSLRASDRSIIFKKDAVSAPLGSLWESEATKKRMSELNELSQFLNNGSPFYQCAKLVTGSGRLIEQEAITRFVERSTELTPNPELRADMFGLLLCGGGLKYGSLSYNILAEHHIATLEALSPDELRREAAQLSQRANRLSADAKEQLCSMTFAFIMAPSRDIDFLSNPITAIFPIFKLSEITKRSRSDNTAAKLLAWTTETCEATVSRTDDLLRRYNASPKIRQALTA